MFVRKTRSRPSAVPIRLMGTGEVRGRSALGREAMAKAQTEARAEMGETARRTVE